MSEVIIKVKILPRSSLNKIIGMEDDVLKIKVKPAPVQGLANKELITLLSKHLRIAKDKIEIISGHKSRLKAVKFRDIDELSILNSLNGFFA